MQVKNIVITTLFFTFGAFQFASAQAELPDCKQKLEDLRPEPRSQDTVRVIDPETYEESVRVTDVYMPNYEELEVVHVEEKGNMKIHYVISDVCLMVSHIERKPGEKKEN